MEEGAGFEPCCRRICSAPLIRMSFPSVGAPHRYGQWGAMKLIREREIEPPFWRTLWPMSNHRGDYSDSPAGKESEVKKRPRPRIKQRLRVSLSLIFIKKTTILYIIVYCEYMLLFLRLCLMFKASNEKGGQLWPQETANRPAKRWRELLQKSLMTIVTVNPQRVLQAVRWHKPVQIRKGNSTQQSRKHRFLLIAFHDVLIHYRTPSHRKNGIRGIFMRLPENVNGKPSSSGRCLAVHLTVCGSDPSTGATSTGVRNSLSLF